MGKRLSGALFSIQNKHTIMLALTSNEERLIFKPTVDETRGETEQSAKIYKQV
jgi:hypothetical protein